MGGGAGNDSYTVTFIKSADVPDNYADYLSYRDYSTGSSDPIAIKDGASIKAGTKINWERKRDVSFYIDGVEFQNDYEMPNHSLTVEVVADGHLEENVILAKSGVPKPNAWNTVTINANKGSFDNGTGNVSSLTLYVNPLYEVELIEAGGTTSYSYLYTLRAPKGKIIKEGLKGTFTAPNTTFDITYDDLPNTTITLHNWDDNVVNPPLTKPRDTRFNDILTDLREKQKQPKEGYKFICWTKRKDMQNSLKSSTYRSKINAGDFVWDQKYDDIIYYYYNVADGYNGYKNNVDLYECITPINNTIVYKFLARKFKNGIDIDRVEYVNVLGDNSQTKYKEFLNNTETGKKLYKITSINPLQYEEVTNLDEIITTDTALLELEGSQGEEPGESEKHRELLVVGEPKVKYTEENTATLDLSHMVVALVDANDESKVTYVPYEKFNDYGITTSPAHGYALDATFNSKSIKVKRGSNFTYTKLGLMVKKENELYIPYYEVLNAKLNESVGKDIEFLDELSAEHKKADRKPIDYKVTLMSNVLDFNKTYCHFSERGFYNYKFTDEDAGKVYTLPVLVTYRDGTTDKTNIVIKVDPKPNQEESAAPTVDEIKELSTEITGAGIKGAKIQVFKGDKPIGEAIVDQDNKWKITNIDANELKKDDSITVMQTEDGKKATSTDATVIADTSKTDAEKYEAKSTKIVKEHGQAVTEEEVKNAVTVEGYPANATKPVVTIDAGQTLPNGQTAGTTKISVTVKYPDSSEDKLQVEVVVKDKVSIAPAYHGNVHANPLNPLPGDLVRLTAIPDNGFELDYFDVRDQFGNPVKVYGDYFYMPDGPVNVHAVFREIGSYYRPYYPDNYDYRYRRNRRDNNYNKDYNEKDTIVEENPVKVYEAIALVTIGSKNLEKTVNGVHTVTLMDVAAQIKNGRTMIPLRYVAEALGFNVTWIKETRTVVIYDNQFKVEIPVDTNSIIVNGVKFESDVKPQLVNNRTLLPIANIARALGLKDGTDILWNPTTRQATIIRRVYSK